MLKFITNLFTGKKKEAPVAPTPYKVEASKLVATAPKVTPVPKVAKKPAVKKATTTKPKKPKAPKA
jgi:hypothetical protein